jgi:hypothetical protein
MWHFLPALAVFIIGELLGSVHIGLLENWFRFGDQEEISIVSAEIMRPFVLHVLSELSGLSVLIQSNALMSPLHDGHIGVWTAHSSDLVFHHKNY